MNVKDELQKHARASKHERQRHERRLDALREWRDSITRRCPHPPAERVQVVVFDLLRYAAKWDYCNDCGAVHSELTPMDPAP